MATLSNAISSTFNSEHHVGVTPSSTLLRQQLSDGKEMGFSDEELLATLELGDLAGREKSNKKHSTFRPFASANAMLDILKEVQRQRDQQKSSNGVAELEGRWRFPSNWKSSAIASLGVAKNQGLPPSKSPMARSSSFLVTPSKPTSSPSCSKLDRSPTPPAQNKSTLQRLIATFEAENRRHFDEYKRLNHALQKELAACKERERKLRNMLTERESETERLRADSAKVEELFRDNSKLRVELIEKDEIITQLSMALNQPELDTESVDRARASSCQSLQCAVCMDREREVIFMPCLHFSCCKQCATSLEHCGVCRMRIMGRIEFFQ